MDKNLIEAKTALDKIISKARVHLYKPIHIAEILYYSRNQIVSFSIEELDTYRTISRRWRDEISLKLVGRKSTSSARYQDDVFNENAMPPRLLALLNNENKSKKGIIEAYIYKNLSKRLQDVNDAFDYLKREASVDIFSLESFLSYFENRPGLRRSIDKAYEIIVYALFSTLVNELKATISLTLDNPDPEILSDFELFAKYVLGVTKTKSTITKAAQIYRVGVANAADRGLDMLTNFGPAVQVKHLRLDESLADDIAGEIATGDVVIVCKTAEANLIKSLLNQIGMPIRGIVTQDDLSHWYNLCITKYKDSMGYKVLKHLQNEFLQEFPSLGKIVSFMEERCYNSLNLTGNWQI